MKQRFIGTTDFQHGKAAATGVLLVNLGTPDAPDAPALRRYLAEFLSDPRVVEIPQLIWKLILHGIILRLRPKKSAQAYAKVWTDEGSPLMVHGVNLTKKVAQRLEQKAQGKVITALAMRYGNPSMKSELNKLRQSGMDRLLVLPLYPQYSGATTGSVADALFKEIGQWRWVPELALMGAYHDHPAYIKALATSIDNHWQQYSRGDKLLMSFHGMPRRTLDLGDPYYCQCHKTARLLADELGLSEDQWEMAFQSRFGKAEWLQPYVAERMQQLPAEGVKHLDVICPGFVSDCVETLEEIQMEAKEDFVAAGGLDFKYIPAMNAEDYHADLMVELILERIGEWPAFSLPAQTSEILEKSRAMAEKMGAEK